MTLIRNDIKQETDIKLKNYYALQKVCEKNSRGLSRPVEGKVFLKHKMWT